MDLILIRHPEVAVASGICYGRSDVPLAMPPQAEIARLVTRLEALCTGQALHFHASTLSRCIEIARPLASRFDAAVRADLRLREIDFGRWEMQTWDAIPRAELDGWAADVEHACAHGGESVAQLAARVQGWLSDLEVAACNAHAGPAAPELAVVVTHAGVIRVLAALALRLPLVACLDWRLELGALCHIRRRPGQAGWLLVSWNS